MKISVDDLLGSQEVNSRNRYAEAKATTNTKSASEISQSSFRKVYSCVATPSSFDRRQIALIGDDVHGACYVGVYVAQRCA